MSDPVRKFESGATRNADADKLDFEGFLSPLVLKRYAEYMHKHRKQADGTMRDSDNWQKGIPLTVYIKSAWRHFIDVWSGHRGLHTTEDIETNLCALIFNASGYLHERLKSKAALDELVTIGQAMGDYDNRRFDRDLLPPNLASTVSVPIAEQVYTVRPMPWWEGSGLSNPYKHSIGDVLKRPVMQAEADRINSPEDRL